MPSQNDAIEPANCKTMADVRRGVDVTDAALVELLVRRFAYMDAAARIKSERNAVRDEARKAQVIANVEMAALAAGIPVQAIAEIWDGLIEASIQYEQNAWDRLNVNPA